MMDSWWQKLMGLDERGKKIHHAAHLVAFLKLYLIVQWHSYQKQPLEKPCYSNNLIFWEIQLFVFLPVVR